MRHPFNTSEINVTNLHAYVRHNFIEYNIFSPPHVNPFWR